MKSWDRSLPVALGRKRGILLLALALWGAMDRALWSERLVFTTSYPSPAGIYQQLLTTGGAAANPRHTILARDAGRVGIGVAAPQEKLEVRGNIMARGQYLNRRGELAFIVAVALDDCSGQAFACPPGYVSAGQWHVGQGCSGGGGGNFWGPGFLNGQPGIWNLNLGGTPVGLVGSDALGRRINSGWMQLCAAR